MIISFLFIEFGWAKAPKKSPSLKIAVHKRTQNFVDIEAPKGDVWVSCSDFPENDKSFLGFHILDGVKSYMFFYRRPLSITQCHKDEKEYLEMIKSSNTVRIVGISPDEKPGPEPRDKSVPKRFTDTTKITSAVFIRLQAKDKCKSFFKEDCELPKNYWGGIIPQ